MLIVFASSTCPYWSEKNNRKCCTRPMWSKVAMRSFQLRLNLPQLGLQTDESQAAAADAHAVWIKKSSIASWRSPLRIQFDHVVFYLISSWGFSTFWSTSELCYSASTETRGRFDRTKIPETRYSKYTFNIISRICFFTIDKQANKVLKAHTSLMSEMTLSACQTLPESRSFFTHTLCFQINLVCCCDNWIKSQFNSSF